MVGTGKPVPKPVYVFRPTHQDLLQVHNNKEVPARSINHMEFISLESSLNGQGPHHLSLLTVDNHGWASIWNLDSRRIQSFWQPHPRTESIGGCLWAAPLISPQLSPESQYLDRSCLLILSQGRDHKLKINQIDNYIETCNISTIARANLKPTITKPSTNVNIILETSINSINFCKASLLNLRHILLPNHQNNASKIHHLVAVPSSITEELVDIFGIQIEDPPKIIKIYQGIPSSSNDKSKKRQKGSVVAVQLFTPAGAEEDGIIILIIGYESGEINIVQNQKFQSVNNNSDWEIVARFKCHNEPILSLAVSIDPIDPLAGFAWSVGADRNIVKYLFSCRLINFPTSSSSILEQTTQKKYDITTKAMIFETNQVGRFDIKIRSDGKVLGIYNWGGKVWLFDTKGTFSLNSKDEKFKQQDDFYNHHEYFKLNPIGLLNLPTDTSNRSGVHAFSPFPPHPISNNTNHLDSLVGLALLVASGSGGQVTAWEVFPPTTSSATTTDLVPATTRP